MITRFAPSPTGLLHLGHVANAVYVWGIAAARGGAVLLRLEDHDRGRFRVEYEHAILQDVEWLGLRPDYGSIDSFRRGSSQYRQSDCGADYQRFADALRDKGLLYACECTRAEILAASDVVPGEEALYDGRCRERSLPMGPGRGLRVRLPTGSVTFEDINLGLQVQDPTHQCGDMLIRDRSGNWTYQFCVVVDDLMQGITAVIRGEDLLMSTGRQLSLRSLLGAESRLTFFHHSLIQDDDGRKLSKRDGDLGLDVLRARGLSPEDVLGRAAFLVGLSGVDEPVGAGELAGLF